jgi:hypothetical protein
MAGRNASMQRLLLKLSLQLYLVSDKRQPANEKSLEWVFCAVGVVGGLEERFPLLDQLKKIRGGGAKGDNIGCEQ